MFQTKRKHIYMELTGKYSLLAVFEPTQQASDASKQEAACLISNLLTLT